MLPDPERIEEAAALLRAGELVAFPTETVYGLGADAANPAAVAKIFAAKGRPASHPLIVHLSGIAAAQAWASGMPDEARRLAEAFWPGPLTLVLPKAERVSPGITGGQDTVALRSPAHPVARALLAAFGGGIAAPSANRYGRISPTRAADVREELGDAVAMVLDGGACAVGLESTIVACLGGRVTLLRPGAISRSQLADVVGRISDPDAASPRAPGRMRTHYAPRTPLRLLDSAALAAELARARAAGSPIAVMARGAAGADAAGVAWRRMPDAPADYARALYASLRELDRAGVTRILVERVPETEAWAAIADRLARAAAGGDERGAEGVPEAP
jgi:L-threonylcarbamoyladenylate synthase